MLAGLMDMAGEAPDTPALAATLESLVSHVDYDVYREATAAGVGAEWTPLHLHAGAEIQLGGFGGSQQAVQGLQAAPPIPSGGPGSPLLKLDVLDVGGDPPPIRHADHG